MSKEKVGFITSNISRDLSGGKMYSQMILDSLNKAYSVYVVSLCRGRADEDNNTIYLDKTKNKWITFLFNFLGYSQGLTPNNIKEIESIIEKLSLTIVWIDGSQYGRIAKYIKLKFPKIKVITSFHNVEYLLRRKSKEHKILNFISSYSDYYNEHCALKYSNRSTFITELDKKIAGDNFHYVENHRLDVLPMGYKIKDNNFFEKNNFSLKDYVLFVGSYYGPNVDAIKFIDTEVANNINCKVVLIGSGLTKDNLNIKSNNIIILGRVDDLTKYYINARCVIAPIFYGGGMKVKIGEALSYGKYVIATDEGLVGYEKVLNKEFIIRANDSKDYIEYINKNNFPLPRNSIKNDFLEAYGFESFLYKVKKITVSS